MRQVRIAALLAWMVGMTGLGFWSSGAEGDGLDFGTYQVKLEEGMPWVCLPDGQKVMRFFTQAVCPKGTKEHTYENFTMKSPVIEKEKNAGVIRGAGELTKQIGEEGISVEVSLEMKYELVFSNTGKVKLAYAYMNKGDDVLIEMAVLTQQPTVTYDLYKGQNWEVKKTEGQIQKGVWPEERVDGVFSINYDSGQPVENQVLSAKLDTKAGKPVIYHLNPQMHLRLTGGAAVSLYNWQHFAGEWSQYDWKTFKKGETFLIEAEIELPVNPGKLLSAEEATGGKK